MIKKIFPAFGTINTVTLFDSCNSSILEKIKQTILEMHNRFSFLAQIVKFIKSTKMRESIQLRLAKIPFICCPLP